LNVTRVFEAFATGLLLAAWLFASQTIPALPPTVPTHFGSNGLPDAMGTKALLYALPLLCTLAYALMSVTQRLPLERMNFPVKITDRNRNAVYALAREMLPALKVGILLTLFGVEWGSIDGAARGELSSFFMTAVFGPVVLIIGILVTYTVRMRSA
jgi:uncharacterized membrane protein